MSPGRRGVPAALFLLGLLSACASQSAQRIEPAVEKAGRTTYSVVKSSGEVTLGDPLAVTVDFEGNPIVADAVPGRIVRFLTPGDRATEFQLPARSPGFYPSDVKSSGFFIYALDEVGRVLLRFDRYGAYRDVLINFDNVIRGRRVSPVGMDVDNSGRIAVTDVESHQLILFDSYLAVELVFGSYGSFPGQLNSPEGVSFTSRGDLLVADTGNRRVQLFDSSGRLLKNFPAAGQDNPLIGPRRSVMDDRGFVYVADPVAGEVFVFNPEGILSTTIYPAGATAFQPTDLEVTRSGVVYVTDAAGGSLFIFR